MMAPRTPRWQLVAKHLPRSRWIAVLCSEDRCSYRFESLDPPTFDVDDDGIEGIESKLCVVIDVCFPEIKEEAAKYVNADVNADVGCLLEYVTTVKTYDGRARCLRVYCSIGRRSLAAARPIISSSNTWLSPRLCQ